MEKIYLTPQEFTEYLSMSKKYPQSERIQYYD